MVSRHFLAHACFPSMAIRVVGLDGQCRVAPGRFECDTSTVLYCTVLWTVLAVLPSHHMELGPPQTKSPGRKRGWMEWRKMCYIECPRASNELYLSYESISFGVLSQCHQWWWKVLSKEGVCALGMIADCAAAIGTLSRGSRAPRRCVGTRIEPFKLSDLGGKPWIASALPSGELLLRHLNCKDHLGRLIT